jgi:hypothetical protein
MMKKKIGPDFLCVGMQKGGTQWIYDAMVQLPGVFMPIIKELNHFALFVGRQKKGYVDATFRNRLSVMDKEYADVPIELREKFRLAAEQYLKEPTHKHYRQLFCMSGNKITGDVSPAYSVLTGREIRKVKNALPNARIVLSIRHPVARAWSHFNMHLRREMARDGLTEGQMYDEIIKRAQPDAFREFLHVRRSNIMSSGSLIHERWSRHYQNVLVINFDDIVKRPASVVTILARELVGTEIDEAQAPEVPNAKESSAKAKISDSHTEIGLEHFKEEIARCRERFEFAKTWEG